MFDNPLKRTSSKPSETQGSEPSRDAMQARPQMTERNSTSLATIGPSILIKGELSGEEDLLIQGRVEGTINLKQNHLTIGHDGKVSANVHAHTVIIEGTLKGDVYGEEKVIIKKSGNVNGNVTAPRVSLEDGAKFKGSMDMDTAKRSDASTHQRNDTASVFKLDKTPGVDKSSAEPKEAVQ